MIEVQTDENKQKVMFMLSKNITKRGKENLPCKFNSAIAIRNTMLGDEQQLLAFYLSLSDDNKHFFRPWAFTYDPLMQPSLGRELDKLLAFVSKKREAGKLRVATMGALASYLNSQRKIQVESAQ